MIEEEARVVAVENDRIWVETQRRSACGQCAANQACGTGVISKVFGERSLKIEVQSEETLHLGEQVVIGIQDDALVRGSAVVYLLPIVLMIGLAALAETYLTSATPNSTQSHEWLTVLAGGLGLALGFVGVRQFSIRQQRNPRYKPTVVRRLGINLMP